MEIATTAGIVAVVYAFLAFVKFLLSKILPDKTCKDLEEIKGVVYSVRDTLKTHEVHAEYNSEAQKNILKMVAQISNTQEKMTDTMERMVTVLDRIDRRHE